MESNYWTDRRRLPRRKLLRFGAVGLGAASLLAACGGSHPAGTGTGAGGGAASDTSGSGGTLTIGMTAGNIPIPDTPPDQGYEGRRFVGYQIYEGLAGWNVNQGDTVPQPVPALAEKWQIGDDRLTWTFTLRQGVKFHDGTDFNADAVVFGLDRVVNRQFEFFNQDLYASARSNTQWIAGYRAVDPATVEIKTTAPYAFLLSDLAFLQFPSPAAVKQYGNKEYFKHPIGTGPFKVMRYVDGQVLELAPNRDYWGNRPKLDKLVLRPMPDPATRLSALQSGEINWAEAPPPDARKQLEAQRYNILLKEYPHAIVYFLNTLDKPFDDVRVRRALQYAINREGMSKNLLNGLATPATQMMYKGHPWYDESFGDTHTYDLAKAKQLLAEAGYPNGFKTTFAFPTSGSGNMWPVPMDEAVQSDFKAVGVDLILEPLEWLNIISMYRSGFASADLRQKYGGFFFSVATISPPNVMSYLSSTRIPPAGCCNPSVYKSEQSDQLSAQAQATFDKDKQDALIRQAMGVMAADSPALFVVHDLNFRALSPQVRGFVQPQSWFCDLTSVWVKS